MWTFARYRTWLEKKTNFHVAGKGSALPEEDTVPAPQVLPPIPTAAAVTARKTTDAGVTRSPSSSSTGGRIEIEPMDDFDQILKTPQK